MDTEMLGKVNVSQAFSILTGGFTVAAIYTIFGISLAVLLFSGSLAEFIPQGVGTIMLGAVIFNLAAALTSSYPGMISVPQDSVVAILVLISASMLQGLPSNATATERYATVITAVIITTLATGVFFVLLGYLKLGRLVRYVPQPVIGGFLAGTGWVILRGSLGLLTGMPLTLGNLPRLFEMNLVWMWLPALVFAILMLVVLRRVHHPWIMPMMLFGAIVLFFVGLRVAGVNLEEAARRGWLLGPFPPSLWQPYQVSMLSLTNWEAIWGHSLQIGGVLIVSVLALLFNVTGLEMTVHRDIDLDHELRSAGLANLLAGWVGSPVGYQTLTLSALAGRVGRPSRWTGVVAAAFLGVFLAFGVGLLAIMPKMALGGLLLYLGMAFLWEWVYDAWFILPRSDYFLVWLILIVIGAVGFLEGVAAGMGIAVVLFVINYSRIDMVKHAVSGNHYHSSQTRPGIHASYLRQQGDQILLLELQGYLFFGTAYALLQKIRQRVKDDNLPTLHYAVLDFRQVNGIDSSAVFSLVRLRQFAEDENIHLVVTGLAEDKQARLMRAGFGGSQHPAVTYQASLDYGLEYCENQLLEQGNLLQNEMEFSLQAQFERIFHSPETASQFRGYLEPCDFAEGEAVFCQGDAVDGMYFVEKGLLSVQITLEHGENLRLRTIQPGAPVGEIALYRNSQRTASVVAIKPSTLYWLSNEACYQMQQESPQLVAVLHHWMAHLMAERLSDNSITVRALQG